MNAPLTLELDEPKKVEALELYGYQAQAVEALRENIRNGVMNQVLSAPTGSGKTQCSIYLIREAHAKGKHAVFVCDRVSLINQTSAALDRYGIPHGVVQANHWRWEPYQRVQVASAQTLARRQWPEADLIVVDECHGLQKVVLDRIGKRDCVTIGLTATPFTRGLGKHYDAVVSVTTTNVLMAQGYLAPFQAWAPSEPDMTGAKTVGGEWTDTEAEKRAMPIVGDCVAEYLRHGGGAKFICFGATVAHCEELAKQFRASGVQVALYTYHTGDEERLATLADFRKRDSRVRGLISVAALARGFDVEDVGVVILARPLRSSLAEHVQQIGRGLRRDPGDAEKVCKILDHAGNMERFWGRMQEFFEVGATTLDDGKKRAKKKPDPKAAKARKCPSCSHVHSPRPTCPVCGFEYPRKTPRHESGELKAFVSGAAVTATDRRTLHAQLLWIARERGYKSGWAAHQYAERFGTWPPRGSSPGPQPASPELVSWVRSRMIRYHKSKAKDVAAYVATHQAPPAP